MSRKNKTNEDDNFIDKSKFGIAENKDAEVQKNNHNIHKQSLGPNTRQ